MEYTIKKLGLLAGISTRTLRYYDKIGLLKPCRINSSGYRIYGPQEVDSLQQILFYKELGLELNEIAEILKAPDFERLQALKTHLAALQSRQQQIKLLIQTVNKTIMHEEGKLNMTDQEKFEGFKKQLLEENEEKYGDEIREQYGNEQISRSNEKMMKLTAAEYNQMQSLAAEIIDKLEQAVAGKENPTGPVGREIAGLHKNWLTFSWPSYSKEAHRGLAGLYTADERFTAYYDKRVNGCAQFLCDAITAFTV